MNLEVKWGAGGEMLEVIELEVSIWRVVAGREELEVMDWKFAGEGRERTSGKQGCTLARGQPTLP